MIGRCISIFVAAAFWLAPMAAPTNAHATSDDVGTYGAPFLQIPVGARAMTVPDVVSGMSPDASLLFSNSAALSDMDRAGLFVSTSRWLDEFNFTSLSVAAPLRSTGLTWSLGTRLMFSGNLQGYNASGQVVEEDRFYDAALTAGLGKHFKRIGLALGVNATYVREHFPDVDGDGFTYSFGVIYRRGASRFTVSAENLKGTIAFPAGTYPIQSRVVTGYGRAIRTGLGTIDVGGEISIAGSAYERFRLGATYFLNQFFSVSGGIDHSPQQVSRVDMPFTGGFGVLFNDFSLNYAYTPQQYFSSTHAISLAFSFGESRSSTRRETMVSSARGAGTPSAPATARNGQPTTPITTPAEKVGEPIAGTPAKSKPVVQSYLVVAGRHSRIGSARAEARALHLLKVPAVVEATSTGSYRVIIERCQTLARAEKVVESYENKGHRFTILAITH